MIAFLLSPEGLHLLSIDIREDQDILGGYRWFLWLLLFRFLRGFRFGLNQVSSIQVIYELCLEVILSENCLCSWRLDPGALSRSIVRKSSEGSDTCGPAIAEEALVLLSVLNLIFDFKRIPSSVVNYRPLIKDPDEHLSSWRIPWLLPSIFHGCHTHPPFGFSASVNLRHQNSTGLLGTRIYAPLLSTLWCGPLFESITTKGLTYLRVL